MKVDETPKEVFLCDNCWQANPYKEMLDSICPARHNTGLIEHKLIRYVIAEDQSD